MNIGIAGWPLRGLSLDEIATVFSEVPVGLIEIPKDLLDVVPLKKLFLALAPLKKAASLAGTTDFANLAGLSWGDYKRYLGIQIAAARFLKCSYWRVFVGADEGESLRLSLDRIGDLAENLTELEIVIETHGGFESTQKGFEYCLSHTPTKFVVDFANISDKALWADLASGEHADRIAYFHLRNIDECLEAEYLRDIENEALRAYPRHFFLWEPKEISGAKAVEMFRKLQTKPPL